MDSLHAPSDANTTAVFTEAEEAAVARPAADRSGDDVPDDTPASVADALLPS